MSIRVKREHLLARLESVSAGLSNREIVEQSSCFVFDKGQVMTYNDEISCRTTGIEGLDFTGAVQAAPLIAMLKKLPEDVLEVVVTEKELQLIGKRRETGIALEKDILLPIDVVDKPKKWKRLSEDFAEAISLVSKCASTDETQFILMCVHLHPKYVEACNFYEIARYKVKSPVKSSVLVRAESLKQIVPLDMTRMCVTKSWLHFKNPNGLILSCRRIEAEYPPTDDQMKCNGTSINLPKGLADAADRGEVFSSEDKENNLVLITLTSGTMVLESRGTQGWHRESKKSTYEGEKLKFMISPKIIADLTKRHNGCEITKERLKVAGGRFTYITCLGAAEEKKKSKKKKSKDKKPKKKKKGSNG